MNTLMQLIPETMIARLGWTLMHFVWQGTAIAGALAVVLAAMRVRTANGRYVVSCCGLLLMAAVAVTTFLVMPEPSPRQVYAQDTHPMIVAPAGKPVYETTATSNTPPKPPLVKGGQTFAVILHEWTGRLGAYLPWVVLAWLTGTLGLSARLLAGWVQVQHVRRRLVEDAPRRWQIFVNELAERLPISRSVRLLVSAASRAPMTIGWLRPVILLPVGALTGLTVEQLRALLAHELAHIRRHDYLVNMAQSVIETLLFYHPAVWWLSRRIRLEREHCCDDVAVAMSGSAISYVRALERMETLRAGSVRLAVAAGGGSLIDRIRRLLVAPTGNPSRWSGWLAGAIPLMVLLIGLTLSVRLTAAPTAALAESIGQSPVDKPKTHGDTGHEVASRPGEEITQLQKPLVGTWYFDNPEGDAEQMAVFPNGRVVVLYSNGHRDEADLGNNSRIKLAEYGGNWFAIRAFDGQHLAAVLLRGGQGEPIGVAKLFRRIDPAPKTTLLKALTGPDRNTPTTAPVLPASPAGGGPASPPQFVIDTRFVSAKTGGQKSLKDWFEAQVPHAKPAGVETAIINDGQFESLMRRTQELIDSTTVDAPRLVTLDGNEVCLNTRMENPLDSSLAEPTAPPRHMGKDLRQVQVDGLLPQKALKVRPTLQADGRHAELMVEASFAGNLNQENWTQDYARYGPAQSTIELNQTLMVRIPQRHCRVKFVAREPTTIPSTELYELVREPLDPNASPEQYVYLLLRVKQLEGPTAPTSLPAP